MPFFSIIIPVYNVAPYLRECLDSVLAQTFTDWEAICVDDGSTDGSGAILDEYAAKDKRFRVIHQPNAGVSAARNKALDVAQGEWIWFVDADDVTVPIALERFACMEEKADVTYFSMQLFYSDGFAKSLHLKYRGCTTLDDTTSFALLELMDNSLGVDAFGWTWDKFIRRQLVDANKLRFSKNVSYFEDELFALDVFRFARTFSTLQDVFYRYRILDTSLTRSRKWQLRGVGGEFATAVGKAKWEGLKRLAFLRAYGFLLNATMQRNGIGASKDLLKLIRQYSAMCGRQGNLNKLSLLLTRMFPTALGGLILWLALRLRRWI